MVNCKPLTLCVVAMLSCMATALSEAQLAGSLQAGSASSSVTSGGGSTKVERLGHGSSSSDTVVRRRLASSSGGDDSDSTTASHRIFLVQRGHMLTPRVLASAVLAKNQILAAGGSYHFMFKSAHQRNPLAPSTTSALSLAMLHDSLGSAHVSHITALEIVTQFPGLVEWSSDFGLGGYEKTSSDAFDYALYSRLKKGELAGDAFEVFWTRTC